MTRPLRPGAHRHGLAALVALAALAVTSPGAGAQEWRLDAVGGRYRTAGAPVGGTDRTAILGVRYFDGAKRFGLLGGVPMSESDAPWGTLTAAWQRAVRRGPLAVGLRVAAQGFVRGGGPDTALVEPGRLPPAFSDAPIRRRGAAGGGVEPSGSGWGASGEVTPLLSLDVRGTTVEGRAGVAAFSSAFGDERYDRTLAVAQLRVWRVVQGRFAVAAEAKGHWAEEATYPYVGASGLMVDDAVQAWVSLGTWLHDQVDTTPWSLGASFDATDRVTLIAAVRRDAFDPLFQTPARTSWSLGASVALGRRDTPRAPVPHRYEDGVATLVLAERDAPGAVRVAGDFNDWKPEPMTLREGRWILPVALSPGVYYYAFVAPDGTWFVPESVAGRKPDGFGGYVAVLVVE